MPNNAKSLTEKELAEVEVLAGLGMRFEDIALTKNMCLDTLKKYADDHLQRGKAKAKAQVMQSAYKMAMSGKHPAMTMFWLKTQCGWREKGVDTSVTVNLTPTSPQQVANQVSQALSEAHNGQIHPSVASSISSLANTLLKAIQQGDLEERLTALEQATNNASTHCTGDTLEELLP